MRGKFVGLDGESVVLEHDPDLPDATYAVSPWCVVTVNGQPGKLDDLRPGDELVLLGVPVVSIDNKVSLFESNAIAEYLDETIAPRLHPDDPVQRAINRAWTDYLPTFSEMVTGQAYADDEAAYKAAVAKIPVAFERLERALQTQGAGPFFNGAKYSLVDAAYAPFLQRYGFLDRIRPLGVIEKFPRLKAWTEALLKRPSTHSFPEAEFEALYRLNVKLRKKWLSQFIADQAVAAE